LKLTRQSERLKGITETCKKNAVKGEKREGREEGTGEKGALNVGGFKSDGGRTSVRRVRQKLGRSVGKGHSTHSGEKYTLGDRPGRRERGTERRESTVFSKKRGLFAWERANVSQPGTLRPKVPQNLRPDKKTESPGIKEGEGRQKKKRRGKVTDCLRESLRINGNKKSET